MKKNIVNVCKKAGFVQEKSSHKKRDLLGAYDRLMMEHMLKAKKQV